jgi:hypothetical protein
MPIPWFYGSPKGLANYDLAMPEDAKEYLARARHCLDIASAMQGPRRLILLEMAQAWSRLARQAERNRKADIVYETPRRSNGGGHSPQHESE